jgi:hypothetical protein
MKDRYEEYVHISLKTYNDMKDDYQFVVQRFVDVSKENEENEKLITGLKKALLRSAIDLYNIRNHSMDEIIDPNDFWFAYESEKGTLQEVGITIEEMVEYARTYKEQYDAENEVVVEE